MAFGNFLFGGVIGVGVDTVSGAAYDYPNVVTVRMGRSLDAAAYASESASQPGAPAGTVAPARSSTAERGDSRRLPFEIAQVPPTRLGAIADDQE